MSEWLKEYNNMSLGVTLGDCADTGKPLFQFNDDRYRHTVVIGRTGSGKSNHVLQMEREDIRSGAGLAIIAAHEEDAVYPLTWVPEDRMNDVYLIDATNTAYLPRLNPLDVDRGDPAVVDKAIADCIRLLTTGEYYQWAGTRFKQFARTGLQTMLHPRFPDEPHLALLGRLYTDPDYVRHCLDCCDDRNLRTLWSTEASARRSYDHDDAIQWFLAKVERIAGSEMLQHVFGPGPSTIDIGRIVDEGKILVAVIPEARVGADAAQILAAYLLSQLHDAILNRGNAGDVGSAANMGAKRGPASDLGVFGNPPDALDALDPFFVYVDEFGKFASPEFAELLSESRKYHVGFVLSFQTLGQANVFDKATGAQSNLMASVLGNVGTIICYPLGVQDAALLAGQFDTAPSDLRRIARYRPLASVCLDNQPSQLMTLVVGLKPQPDRPNTARRIARRQIGRRIWLSVATERERREMLRRKSYSWLDASFGLDDDTVVIAA